MAKLTQEQIAVRMRRLDDVFHRMIIALERLEVFTEALRLGGEANASLVATGIRTDRDMHDDVANPPSRDTFYGEVQLQLSALFFQTQFDDKEIFNSAVKYFLADLLEWYGGRNASIPYNGVDAFVLPIIASLSQQVQDVGEVMEVVEKYVATIPGISTFSDDQKADAIANGMEKLILVMDGQHHQHHNEPEEEQPTFTEHKRGDKVDGYKRLILAMLSMYDEAMPAIMVYRTVQNFLPEIAESVPNVTEDYIVESISAKTQASLIPDDDCQQESTQEETETSTDESSQQESPTESPEPTTDNAQQEPMAEPSTNEEEQTSNDQEEKESFEKESESLMQKIVNLLK